MRISNISQKKIFGPVQFVRRTNRNCEKKNRFQHKIKKMNKNEFPETGKASITKVTFRIKFQQTNIFNTTETEATDSIQTFKLNICL